IVGDEGVILSTADGGGTWAPEVSGVTSRLLSVFFVSPSLGFAVGANGVILKQSLSVCTYGLDPAGAAVGSAGGTIDVAVTAPAGCDWTATAADGSFATVTAGATGSGNGTVTVSVPA